MLKLNNELISSYEKLVYSIISKYSNESNKEDLFQVGMMGIIDASKRYDSSSGVKFTSFAYKYILGEVLKYLREDRNIKLGRDLISDYKKILITKERFYKSHGRPASIEEISRVLKLSEERINLAINYNEREYSLDMSISDDDKITLKDTIYNKDRIEEVDMIDLKDAFENLSTKEKEIIYKRYFQNKTQTEVAKEINVSQVKVYRFERQILDKLKDKMS